MTAEHIIQPLCCPSCNVPYVDHDGLHRTCARVKELEALVASLSRRLADCSEVLGKAAERGKVCECKRGHHA